MGKRKLLKANPSQRTLFDYKKKTKFDAACSQKDNNVNDVEASRTSSKDNHDAPSSAKSHADP